MIDGRLAGHPGVASAVREIPTSMDIWTRIAGGFAVIHLPVGCWALGASPKMLVLIGTNHRRKGPWFARIWIVEFSLLVNEGEGKF